MNEKTALASTFQKGMVSRALARAIASVNLGICHTWYAVWDLVFLPVQGYCEANRNTLNRERSLEQFRQ